MFKALLSVVALLALNVPQVQSQSYDDYVELAVLVNRIGVEVQVNSLECNEFNGHGWYAGRDKELVVCQENRSRTSTAEVAWTAEDYDTLLHEIHHVVQDCMDGTLDGELDTIYKKPLSFGYDVLGDDLGRVIEVYAELEPYNKVLEIEAFAVARLNDPQEQMDDVRTYCMGK